MSKTAGYDRYDTVLFLNHPDQCRMIVRNQKDEVIEDIYSDANIDFGTWRLESNATGEKIWNNINQGHADICCPQNRITNPNLAEKIIKLKKSLAEAFNEYKNMEKQDHDQDRSEDNDEHDKH